MANKILNDLPVCSTPAPGNWLLIETPSEAQKLDVSWLTDPVGAGAALAAHLALAADAHDASAVSFLPAGSVAATNVQGAIEELNLDHTNMMNEHMDMAMDAHDASAISFTPTAPITATDVQAAIIEAAMLIDRNKWRRVAPQAFPGSNSAEDNFTPILWDTQDQNDSAITHADSTLTITQDGLYAFGYQLDFVAPINTQWYCDLTLRVGGAQLGFALPIVEDDVYNGSTTCWLQAGSVVTVTVHINMYDTNPDPPLPTAPTGTATIAIVRLM